MMLLKWLINELINGGGFPCLFHLITGFYCPGCGGTRAIRMLIHGKVMASFCYHPFVPYAAFALAVEMGFFVLALAGKCLGIGELKGWGDGGEMRDGRAIEEAGDGGVWRRYADGFLRRYPKWVRIAVWVVGVNWVVKNVGLVMGVDLLGWGI